jgi:hypothetical protein
MEASSEKPGYFNYFAKIISLKAPQVAIAQAEPEPELKNGKRKRPGSSGEDGPPNPDKENE